MKNILLNSWCALDARFLSAYACSKLVGTMDDKPLNYSWNDEITNFISSSSSKALSDVTMDDSTWCEKFSISSVFVSMWQLILGGELKQNGSFVPISSLLTGVSFKSTKILGLSAIELETFDNVLSLKTVLLTSISSFNTCLQTFPFRAQLQLQKCSVHPL